MNAALLTNAKAALLTNAKATPFRYAFAAMTTSCELEFYGLTPAAALVLAQAIEARVAGLVKRFNFHASDSWLNRTVNNRRTNRIQVDTETAEILACVREHSLQTQGAFDITAGTLALRLRRARSASDVAEIHRQLTPYRGVERWWLEAQILCFDNHVTRFDLGGVIKEYAVDVSASMARAAGVQAGLINYGGDLYAIGVKPLFTKNRLDVDTAPQRFVAAIVNPLAPEKMLFGLDLEDQALTTSAHYARNRLLKAKPNEPAQRLSHIVGAAESSRWISATVVSGSTLLSGIYSTALLLKDDLTLPAGVTAVVVDATGQVHSMTGFNMTDSTINTEKQP